MMANLAANLLRSSEMCGGYLAIGEVLDGKYRVERTLAEGGCGIVVLATQLQLERPVALKYLRPDMLAHSHVVALFEREARLAAKLRSEHVVRIHDVGVSARIGPYLVMEYLEGADLQTLIDAGPLPIGEAVDYVLQACEALAEAHEVEIVHRDLKPANLFLTNGADGAPVLKVIDFGIAKSVAKRATGAEEVSPGTPGYMSPEQIAGGRIDARSDIWSLGVVLYELLSVRMPWPDGSPTEQLDAIRAQPPARLRIFRPEVPQALEDVVARCLAEDPAKRYPRVRELAAALHELGLVAPKDSASITGRRRIPSFDSVPTMVATQAERRVGPRARIAAAATASVVLFVAGVSAVMSPSASGHAATAAGQPLATASTELASAREPILVTTKLATMRDPEVEKAAMRVVSVPVSPQPRPATSSPAVVTPAKTDRRALFGEGRL